MKTIHGCTCKTDWLTIDGKKTGGCVYGGVGDSAKQCQISRDKLPDTCPPVDNRKWCVVEDKCGYPIADTYSDKEWEDIQKDNKKPWSKLEKALKLKKLTKFAECYNTKNKELLKHYLFQC